MGKIEFLVCAVLLQTFPTVLSQSQKNNCSVAESYILCKDAQGKFLPSVPSDTINYIFISKSDMSSLTPEDFALFPEVTLIEIRYSKVSFPAQNGLFSELSDLTDLRIEHSDVGEEVAAMFAENHFLERLSLRNNRISSITQQMFKKLKNLQELDLSRNNASMLEDGFLEGLEDIRILNLSGNALDGVSPGAVASTSSRCTVCRAKGIPGRCSQEEVRRCVKGRPFDQLWWRMAALTVDLQGNPLCDEISAPITRTQSSSGLYIGGLECEVLLEDCVLHENRKYFLMEACGFAYSKISHGNLETKSVLEAQTRRSIFMFLGTAVVGMAIGVAMTGILLKLTQRQRENKNPGNTAENAVTRDPSDEESGMLLQQMEPRNRADTSIDTSHVLSAALEGDPKTLMRLKEEGKDLTMKNSRGESALWRAALAGQHKVVQFLVEHYPQEVYCANHNGDTPLHVATRGANEISVEMLLAAGAKRSAKNKYGSTPLHMAVSRGRVSIIKLLLEDTENINETNEKGETPLSVAVGSGQIDAVELLLEKGADVSQSDISGLLPIQIAAWNGNETMVRLLLEKKFSRDNRDLHGNTALHDACRKGHTSIVKCLLEKGFDGNARNNRGNTPLHKAVKGDYAETVELLLESGADVNVKNADGLTPLELAREKGKTNCIETITKFLSRK